MLLKGKNNMISLQIKDTKNFMQQILMKETFDSFLLEEASITTFNSFYIDGRMQKDFFTAEELELSPEKNLEFSGWSDIRPIAFQLIKGKHTPLNFHFVLHLNFEETKKILSSEDCTVPENALKSFILNIKYNGSKVSCISATALNTFLIDKSADMLWDKYITTLFQKLQIDFDLE